MRIAPLADSKARFSAYLKESKEGPVIFTRNGKPVAVLISIEAGTAYPRLFSKIPGNP